MARTITEQRVAEDRARKNAHEDAVARAPKPGTGAKDPGKTKDACAARLPGVEVTASEAQLIERMKAKVLEIGTYEKTEEKTREEHKAAKSALEQARDDLVEMVRAVNADEPLTDRMEPDGWKRVKIVDAVGVSLGRKIIDGAAPVLQGDTLGGLTAFLKDRTLMDIRGIAHGSAKKIEDAMEAFWKRNGQWTKGGK